MKAVIAQFILYKQQYNKTNSNAYRQAQYIDSRKTFIAYKAPPGDLDVIPEHSMPFQLAHLLIFIFAHSALYHYVLQNGLSVEHPDNAMAVAGIVLAVRNHYDGGTLFVKIGKQGHYLVTIA